MDEKNALHRKKNFPRPKGRNEISLRISQNNPQIVGIL
jgi:hypothetical protein